ncbi:hypothetical protein G6F32_015764 [Rhizopus arrhizus]|nr:hypothetical protein G6F32_015764 [Rhizopus arrhizus]
MPAPGQRGPAGRCHAGRYGRDSAPAPAAGGPATGRSDPWAVPVAGTLPSCAAVVTFRSCRRQCHRMTAVTAIIAVPAFMLCRTLPCRNRRRPRFRPHPPERL